MPNWFITKPKQRSTRRGTNGPGCLPECSFGPDLCPTQGTSLLTRLEEQNYEEKATTSDSQIIRVLLTLFSYKIIKIWDTEHRLNEQWKNITPTYRQGHVVSHSPRLL